jgi:hypothetical protein
LCQTEQGAREIRTVRYGFHGVVGGRGEAGEGGKRPVSRGVTICDNADGMPFAIMIGRIVPYCWTAGMGDIKKLGICIVRYVPEIRSCLLL